MRIAIVTLCTLMIAIFPGDASWADECSWSKPATPAEAASRFDPYSNVALAEYIGWSRPSTPDIVNDSTSSEKYIVKFNVIDSVSHSRGGIKLLYYSNAPTNRTHFDIKYGKRVILGYNAVKGKKRPRIDGYLPYCGYAIVDYANGRGDPVEFLQIWSSLKSRRGTK